MAKVAAVKNYCEANSLSVFELFLTAYASYFHKHVLSREEFEKVNSQARLYLSGQSAGAVDGIPVYVAEFLHQEKDRQLVLF